MKKGAPESLPPQTRITIQDLFPNIAESDSLLALVGLLQLKFHNLFEQFREGKVDAQIVSDRVIEYICFNPEIFTQLFGEKQMERMTDAGNFRQAIVSFILKETEYPNPVWHFFKKYIKPQIEFFEEHFIRNGVEVGGNQPAASPDTVRSPKSLQETLKILKLKIPKSEEARAYYEILKILTGNGPEAEKFLDWFLVKTAFDFYQIPTDGFKPEHMPNENAVTKAVEAFRQFFRIILEKIPVMRKIL